MFSSNGVEYIFKENSILKNINTKFFVDIGAADGITESNSYWLATQCGFDGVSVECDDNRFLQLCQNQPNNIVKIKQKMNPDNVCDVLEFNGCPKSFGFLSIDIDSYDYFLLDTILKYYKPEIICCEVNEKIPPPIKFKVKFLSEDQCWDNNHFYGVSIKCFDDFKKYGYEIICLDYNNVFLSNKKCFKYKTPEDAYDDGYKLKDDRKTRYYWNSDCEDWLIDQPSSILIDKIKNKFSKYSDMFDICI